MNENSQENEKIKEAVDEMTSQAEEEAASQICTLKIDFDPRTGEFKYGTNVPDTVVILGMLEYMKFEMQQRALNRTLEKAQEEAAKKIQVVSKMPPRGNVKRGLRIPPGNQSGGKPFS